MFWTECVHIFVPLRNVLILKFSSVFKCLGAFLLIQHAFTVGALADPGVLRYRLCNSLPESLGAAETADAFKSRLKTCFTVSILFLVILSL